jgi:excisionase family DNA binding protein
MNEQLALSLPDALIDRIAECVLARIGDTLNERRTASPYLTVNEAAQVICNKRQRIYDLLSAGRLTRFKDGSRVLVSRDELDAYLAGTPLRLVAPTLPTPRKPA